MGSAEDIWSTGIIAFELASGHHPFSSASSFSSLHEQLCELPEPRLDVLQFDSRLCDFIAACLTREVRSRKDVASLMDHEFITRCNESCMNSFATFLSSALQPDFVPEQ